MQKIAEEKQDEKLLIRIRGVPDLFLLKLASTNLAERGTSKLTLQTNSKSNINIS